MVMVKVPLNSVKETGVKEFKTPGKVSSRKLIPKAASIAPKVGLTELAQLKQIPDMITVKLPLHYVEVIGVKKFKIPGEVSNRKSIPKAASIAPKVGLKELAQFKQIPDMVTVKVPLHYVKVTSVEEFKIPREVSSRKLIPKDASIAPKVGLKELSQFEQIPDMVTVKVPLHYVKVNDVKEFKIPGEVSFRKLIQKAASIAPKVGLKELAQLKQIPYMVTVKVSLHCVKVTGVKEFKIPVEVSSTKLIPKAASIAPKVGLKELAQFKQIPDMITVKVSLHCVKVTGVKEFKIPAEVSSRKLILKATSIASKKRVVEMVEFK
jgi:hypothetical protein